MSRVYLVLRNSPGFSVVAVPWKVNGFEVPTGYWFDDVLGVFRVKREAVRHAVDLTAGRVVPTPV